MILRLLCFCLIFATTSLSAPQLAASTKALIIGNDSYDEVPVLAKARADAGGYAAFFEARGVEVALHTDLTGREMRVAIAAFLDSLAPGDTAILVYAGHGWSDGRENYLLGTDVPARASQTLIRAESLSLQNGVNGVLDQIVERGPALTVAVIDACRDNPFEVVDTTRSVGLSRGLTRVRAAQGTFVAFSAGAGQAALDRLSPTDPAPYSVFTRHFLAELARPQDLQAAFKATQVAVDRAAAEIGHPQRPAYYDEVLGAVCLTGACAAPTETPLPSLRPVVPPAAPTVQPADDPASLARLEWQDFRETRSVPALRLFAERHAGTPYAVLALERAALLAQEAAAPATERATPAPVTAPPVIAPPVIAPPVIAPPVTADPVTPPRVFARPAWCPNAGTATERTICQTAELSALDLAMDDTYRTALARGGTPVRDAQRAWLARRNACGSNVGCLRNAYLNRLAALR